MHWHHKQHRGKYNNQTNDLQFHFLTSRRLKWYELCFQYPLLCVQHNNVCPWKWKIVQASIPILTISNLQTLVLTFASDTRLQMYLRILQSDRWCGIDANKYNKILNVSKAPYFTRKLLKKENKMHVIINNVLRQNYTACNSKQHRGKPWQDCFSVLVSWCNFHRHKWKSKWVQSEGNHMLFSKQCGRDRGALCVSQALFI